MNKTTQNLISVFPWVGLLLLLSGAVTYVVVDRFTTLVNILLGLGALLLLLFAVFRPDDVRIMLSGRNFRYGLNTFLSILFVVAIAAILYYVAYSNNDWRYDLTEAGEFTPLPETLALLEGLDQPIKVIGFYTPQASFQQEQARSVLDSLTAYTDQISYEFEDPLSNPLLVEQYALTADATLVFTQGEGENEQFSKASGTAERDIHAALVQVLNPQEKKLYFLSGHGEPAYDGFDETGLGQLQAGLEEVGFTLASLNLFTEGSVPTDASAVIVVDPQAPIPAEEVEALRTYLNGGGSVFLSIDFPATEEMVNAAANGADTIQPLLDDWGLFVRFDVIVDLELAQAGVSDGVTFLGVDFGSSPIITEELPQFGTVFRVARSIAIAPQETITSVELVRTSEAAWGETDIVSLFQTGSVAETEDDNGGPLAVGVSAENTLTGGRLVLFSDSDFIRNTGSATGGNSLLFTNSMNWLARDEFSINLTPRESIQRSIAIPQEQLTLLRWISTWLGPVLMLIIGGAVWYSRRQVR
ncbi:MAG: GldG family protein [Chloroflexi bacterium]|nr:GldG family protein [Chloroflexota bacterium]MBP8057350.1 GldG family protein [Chloroflexota bacterium]